MKTKLRSIVHRGAQKQAQEEVLSDTEMELKAATGIDFRIVKPEDLVFNEYNPNEMDEELFEILTEQTKEIGGVVQPPLVRKHPTKRGKWLVVDGEHRGKSAQIAGVPQLLVAVAPLNDGQAKLKTLAMNHIRGQNIPLKLAYLLVDLQKTYTQEEIARMSGIAVEEQVDVMKLIEVPDFAPVGDDIEFNADDEVSRPVQVTLLLMQDEKGTFEESMVKAMGLMGDDVVALVGDEAKEYNKAMRESMGLTGVKLRNLAFATICKAFLKMPEEFRRKIAQEARETAKQKLKPVASDEPDEDDEDETPSPRTRTRARSRRR